MLSFRQKIVIAYLVLFLLFLGVLFPSTKYAVKSIARFQLEMRAEELIESIRSAPNTATLIHRLRQQEHLLFTRVTVLNAEGRVLYDSHTEKLLGKQFIRGYPTNHPEVQDALKKGAGYSEGYSSILGKAFAYTAKTFDFHGQILVMRTAFPFKQISSLTRDFQIGFLLFGSIVLILFSVMTGFIIHYLTQPIQQIIKAIKPYQLGHVDHIPQILLERAPNARDDFGRLATTLNSLSERIQSQIDTLTHERNEKEAILESLIEGVIAVNNELLVTYSNQMAVEMLGIDMDALMHHRLDACLDETRHELLETCHAVLEESQRAQKVITKTLEMDNNRVYFDIVAAPKDKGAILVMQDKSSHYRILEMRKAFIANASHELKTPITIVRGFAETLNEHPDLAKDIIQTVTEKIVRNCHRMDTLVKNLLTLADIENLPHSRLLYCDLRDVIKSCQQMLASVYPDAVVTVQTDNAEDYVLVADPDLLELAIKNLFENAAKYSKGPAEITADLKIKEDMIHLEVRDHGIGIPEVDIEHIFQRFYTVDKAHSRKMGGSGLGLSIVETIVHKHLGTISLSSQIGVGSTFTIIIPKQMRNLVEEDEYYV